MLLAVEEIYKGRPLRPAWQFASIGTASQMNKAIPLLLEMKDGIKEVRKNTDTIPQFLDEFRGIQADIQPGYSSNFQKIKTDIRAIKERLRMVLTVRISST